MCYDCGAYYLDLRFDSFDVTRCTENNGQRVPRHKFLDDISIKEFHARFILL